MAGEAQDEHRGRIPFWAHQLAEVLLAIVLLVEGARRDAGVAVLGAAVALLLFALATHGPLAAWRGLGRRAHRVGDFVLAAAFAVTPLLFGVDDPVAIVMLLGIAACLVWLGARGDFAAPAPRGTRRGHRDPKARSSTLAAAPRRVPSSHDLGRTLGRLRAAGPRAAGRAVGRGSAERARERATAGEATPERKAPEQPAPRQESGAKDPDGQGADPG